MASLDPEFNPWVTMSICSLGPSTLNKKEAKPFAVKNTNDVSDIDGARTKVRPVYDKPPMLNSDVRGAASKPLTHERNTRDNSLYIDDIEGTRHAVKDRMMRTTRRVNPLVPEYPMASFEPDIIPPSRFIKDPQTHDDIEGSHVKPAKVFAERDTMNVSDIHGAQIGWRRPVSDTRDYNMMDTSAVIPKFRIQDVTNRRTDPCNPIYHINGMEYKDDKHSKPPPERKQILDSSLLQTKDITGATPGHMSAFPRRQFANTNFIGDIEGAQADTTKHSMKTKRQSNPMGPTYQSLDPGEYLTPVVNSLLPPDMIKVPTIPRVSNKMSVADAGHNGHSHSNSTNAINHGSAANNNQGNGSGSRPHSGALQLDFTKSLSNNNNGSGHFGTDSPARGNSNYVSPLTSSRSNSNKAASSLVLGSSRKAIAERQSDIDSVRQLN